MRTDLPLRGRCGTNGCSSISRAGRIPSFFIWRIEIIDMQKLIRFYNLSACNEKDCMLNAY
jgi:hypothetical protein